MNKEYPNDWDMVTAYKRLFNTDDGEAVIRDLKRQSRYDDFSTLLGSPEPLIRSIHALRCVINYVEYMKNRELKQAPEETIEMFPELTNEL